MIEICKHIFYYNNSIYVYLCYDKYAGFPMFCSSLTYYFSKGNSIFHGAKFPCFVFLIDLEVNICFFTILGHFFTCFLLCFYSLTYESYKWEFGCVTVQIFGVFLSNSELQQNLRIWMHFHFFYYFSTY